jgi:predicted NBD/HSP70 family sugar kinase
MPAEQIIKRVHNQNQILRTLHFDGALRRTELARRHGIRKNSITSIVDELLERGFVVEDNPDSLRSRLYLEAKKFHVVTAAVKPNEILFGRVYLDGRLEPLSSVKAPANSRQVLTLIAQRFRREIDGAEDSVVGLGVAARGYVDPQKGVGIYASHLPDWRDVPVGEFIREKIGHAVLVDNDARCSLWEHAWFERLLREHQNILYVLMTEGVGSASIINGRRHVGARFQAGEIGQIILPGETERIEELCSIPALLNDARKFKPSEKIDTAADLTALAKRDRTVDALLDRAVERLSPILASAAMVADPDILLVGSVDRAFSEWLRPKLAQSLRSHGCTGLQDAHVLAAESEDDTMLRGMAGLVIEHAFKTGRLTLKEEPTAQVRRSLFCYSSTCVLLCKF